MSFCAQLSVYSSHDACKSSSVTRLLETLTYAYKWRVGKGQCAHCKTLEMHRTVISQCTFWTSEIRFHCIKSSQTLDFTEHYLQSFHQKSLKANAFALTMFTRKSVCNQNQPYSLNEPLSNSSMHIIWFSETSLKLFSFWLTSPIAVIFCLFLF